LKHTALDRLQVRLNVILLVFTIKHCVLTISRCFSFSRISITYHLDNISPGVHFLSPGLQCNSLMYGVADSLIRRVQSVQNAAARLITGARWQEHSHHASATSVALASSASTSAVQTGLCRTIKSLSAQGPSVLGGWCPASPWQRTASPSISQLQNMHRSSDTEQFWRQTFLLPDLESGTICHRNCNTQILSASDNLDA